MSALGILLTATFWAAVLRIATPLVFGTMGELICERAGVLNLGIEGIMTFGAMLGWLTVYEGGTLWQGFLVAGAAGALFGLLHGALTVPLGLSQHVTGLGVTLLAANLSYYIYRLILPTSSTPPTIPPFQPVAIPWLSDIPFLGPAFLSQMPPIILHSLSSPLSLTCFIARRSVSHCAWSAKRRRALKRKALASRGCASARWSSARR
jgi:simple sugar transport system permease protein